MAEHGKTIRTNMGPRFKNRRPKEDQAKLFSSGLCPQMCLFYNYESLSAVAGSGKRIKMKKTQFIVFSQPYKTPSESKKIVRKKTG